jgi:hypothetical protein
VSRVGDDFQGAIRLGDGLRDKRELVFGEVVIGFALFRSSHHTLTTPTFESSASLMNEYRTMKPAFCCMKTWFT